MQYDLHDQTIETIGGWDEGFRGWGFYDDFITFKLETICQCRGNYATFDVIHLWHPITTDYSLPNDNNTQLLNGIRSGKD